MMTDNVVSFTGITRLKLDPDGVLREAVGALSSVVIVGFTKEGMEYFASSEPDAAIVMFHMDRAKHRLMMKIDQMISEGARADE